VPRTGSSVTGYSGAAHQGGSRQLLRRSTVGSPASSTSVFYRARVRKQMEIGMRFAAVGLAFLIAAGLLGGGSVTTEVGRSNPALQPWGRCSRGQPSPYNW
jgi:hypothetical protein